MKSKLMKWLTPVGLIVLMATASFSLIRGEKAQVLADESEGYATQRRSRSRKPSPSPSPSPDMSPTPTPSPEASPTPSPAPAK